MRIPLRSLILAAAAAASSLVSAEPPSGLMETEMNNLIWCRAENIPGECGGIEARLLAAVDHDMGLVTADIGKIDLKIGKERKDAFEARLNAVIAHLDGLNSGSVLPHGPLDHQRPFSGIIAILDDKKKKVEETLSGVLSAREKQSNEGGRRIDAGREDSVNAEKKRREALGNAPPDDKVGPKGSDKDIIADAKKKIASGDSGSAEALLDKVLDANPNDSEGYALRSMTRVKSGRFEEASNDAVRALALDPKNQLAREVLAYSESARRGQTIRKLGKNPDFNRFLSLDDSFTGPKADKGSGSDFSNVSGGSSVDPKIMRSPPGPYESLLGEVRLKLKLGDLSQALLEASRAVSADKSDPRGWILRSQVLNLLMNHEAALRDSEEALKIDPESVPALLERGLALHKLGRQAEALAALDIALKFDPGSGLGHLYRAMVLESLGRSAEAMREYELAAQLDLAYSHFLEEARKRLGGRGDVPVPPEGRKSPLLWLAILAAAAVMFYRGTRRLHGPQAATPMAPESEPNLSSTPQPGTVIEGAYRIEREIARGGMGVVFEATDLKLKRTVAIKRMRRDAYGSPEARDRFLREAQLGARLRQKNLAQIYCALGVEDLYLVFEFIPGETLSTLLSSRGRFTLEETGGVVKNICEGLDYAHSQKVIHRDLKPSNVIRTPDGVCKILDLGIAHESRSDSGATLTAAWGTPQYMAPEQEKGIVCRESDLYALAVMTYELLTGQTPFAGPYVLEKKLKKEFTPATKVNTALPAAVDGFFDKTLDPEPSRRFSTARGYAEAFACVQA